MVGRHVFEMDSYQTFVGGVAQFTAVNIGKAAEAIAALVRDPGLRRKMGEAGRARVAEAFDWPVVVAAYRALIDELAAIRGAARPMPPRPVHPVKGDPFQEFAGFPTGTLGPDLRLSVPAGVGPGDVRRTGDIELDQAFGYWRATLEECAEVVRRVAAGEAATVRDVLLGVAPARRPAVELGVVWLAKQGFLDWSS
jgi:hypothetical protein